MFIRCSLQRTLCQWVQDYPSLSLQSDSVHLDLGYSLLSLLSWVLCWVMGIDLCILLQADIQLDKNHFFFFKKYCLFFQCVFFGYFGQESGIHRYVNLHLGLQFDSIDQCLYFFHRHIVIWLQKMKNKEYTTKASTS